MLAISLVLLIVTLVFAFRRVMQPLTALAEAADRVGRGEAVEPLTVTGPYEVARTVKAFNVMQHARWRS